MAHATTPHARGYGGAVQGAHAITACMWAVPGSAGHTTAKIRLAWTMKLRATVAKQSAKAQEHCEHGATWSMQEQARCPTGGLARGGLQEEAGASREMRRAVRFQVLDHDSVSGDKAASRRN